MHQEILNQKVQIFNHRAYKVCLAAGFFFLSVTPFGLVVLPWRLRLYTGSWMEDTVIYTVRQLLPFYKSQSSKTSKSYVDAIMGSRRNDPVVEGKRVFIIEGMKFTAYYAFTEFSWALPRLVDAEHILKFVSYYFHSTMMKYLKGF